MVSEITWENLPSEIVERVPEVAGYLSRLIAEQNESHPDLPTTLESFDRYQLLWECFYEGLLGELLRAGEEGLLMRKCFSFCEEVLASPQEELRSMAVQAFVEPVLESSSVLQRARQNCGGRYALELSLLT